MDSPIAFYPVDQRPFTVRAARRLLYRFLLVGLLCILASAWMSLLGSAGESGSAPFLFLYGAMATAAAAYLYVLTLEMSDDEDL